MHKGSQEDKKEKETEEREEEEVHNEGGYFLGVFVLFVFEI